MPKTPVHPPGATLHLGGDAHAHPDAGGRLTPVGEVRNYPGNPRRSDQDAITASVRDLGLYRPVIVQASTGHVLAGNHLFRALLALGATQVPVAPLDVDDTRAAAIVARDNVTSTRGGFDDVELLALLADADVRALSGYADEEYAALLAAQTPPPPPSDVDPDDVPEDLAAPAVRITAPGDVWHLGPHRLLCGDATDKAAVTALCEGYDPARTVLLTDPPYCSGGFQESGKSVGSIGTVHKVNGKRVAPPTIRNDKLSTRGYMALMTAMMQAAPAEQGYLFTDWKMWTYLFDVVESQGHRVRSLLVWDKGSPALGAGWRAQHELVMFASRGSWRFQTKGVPAVGNVLTHKRTGNPLHPTQKPVDLIRRIMTVMKGADLFYDPFGGSGSTMIAAEDQDVPSRLVELDEGYCDVICRRYQHHTGTLPVRNGEAVDFLAG